MLGERGYNFARHNKVQPYVFRQSSSDALTFGDELILETASDFVCINVGHRHDLLLKERHLFNNLDEIDDLLQ